MKGSNYFFKSVYDKKKTTLLNTTCSSSEAANLGFSVSNSLPAYKVASNLFQCLKSCSALWL